jgi:large subunit ribosomal protein L29
MRYGLLRKKKIKEKIEKLKKRLLIKPRRSKMAILRKDEIREMDIEEMYERLSELKSEFSREKALRATGSAPENPGKIGELRRTIARMKTIIAERKRRE